MNNVEKTYGTPLQDVSANQTAINGTDNLDYLNVTSSMSTVAPVSTAMPPNLTVIGTIVKTALTMQNLTTTEDHNINHPYYIYIWAIGILGCILLTTGRLVLYYIFIST